MKHFLSAFLAGLFSFGFFTAPAAAQNSAPDLGDAWASVQLRYVVRPGMSLDDARKRFARLFKQTDVNGGGISQSDYDEKANIMMAQQRSRTISRLLSKDLNGDGVVSADELKAFYLVRARRPIRANGISLEPTQQQIEQMLEQLVRKDLAFDSDGDGMITFPEMLNAAQAKNAKQLLYMRQNRRNVPLEMDQNGDGTVTKDEFDQVIGRVLNKADLNSDGLFSKEELSLIRSRARDIQRMERAARRARKI